MMTSTGRFVKPTPGEIRRRQRRVAEPQRPLIHYTQRALRQITDLHEHYDGLERYDATDLSRRIFLLIIHSHT